MSLYICIYIIYIYVPLCLQAFGHLTFVCKCMAEVRALTVWFSLCPRSTESPSPVSPLD